MSSAQLHEPADQPALCTQSVRVALRFGPMVQNVATVLREHDLDHGGLARATRTLRNAVTCLRQTLSGRSKEEFILLFDVDEDDLLSPDEVHLLAEELSGWLAGFLISQQASALDLDDDPDAFELTTASGCYI